MVRTVAGRSHRVYGVCWVVGERFMLGISAMTVLLAVAQLPEDAVGVSARLDASELTVGEDYEITLDITLKDGWSISTAGVGGAILQIDAPRSIRLSGKVLESRKALAENEYLAAPYERLLVEFPAHIEFTLKKKPKESDRIALNVLAYASTGSDEVYFVRKRLELSLSPEATAVEVEPSTSDWGRGDGLQIGDKAKKFKLPKADGGKVNLKKLLGKSNVIVTTYRAHW